MWSLFSGTFVPVLTVEGTCFCVKYLFTSEDIYQPYT